MYIDNEGWPQNLHTPSYPHQYYYDNGQTPLGVHPPIIQTPQYTSNVDDNHHHHHHHHHHHDQSNSNYAPKIPIRRHTPGTTDPTLHQISLRSSSPPPPKPSSRVTFKRNPSKPKPPSTHIQNHSPVSLDPDERPIKPMKDTSLYYNTSSSSRITQPKKPLQTPKSVQSSPRYESDSYLPPPPPSRTPMSHATARTPMSHATARRPIRTDLIPKTPFGIAPQRNRSRRIIVEEYEDHYPVSYAKPISGKVIEYAPVHGMTTRELENYEMSNVQRIVHVRPPPIRTVIYRS